MISRCMLFVCNNWNSEPFVAWSCLVAFSWTQITIQLVWPLCHHPHQIAAGSRAVIVEHIAVQGSHAPSAFHHLRFPMLLKWQNSFIIVWPEKRRGLKQQKVCASHERVGLRISDLWALDRAGQKEKMAVIYFSFSILSGSSKEERACLVSSQPPWPEYLVQGLEQNDPHWAALSLCLSLPEISGRRHLFLQISVSRLSLRGYCDQLSAAPQHRCSHRLWPHFQRSPHNLII